MLKRLIARLWALISGKQPAPPDNEPKRGDWPPKC